MVDLKIGFGLTFFQAKKELQRLVSTLPKDIPIFAVDGRCTGYPSKHELSNDGSRKVLQKCGATIIDGNDIMEYQKREMYVRVAEEYGIEFLVVIDSDHQLVGNWEQFFRELQAARSDKDSLFSMPVYTQGIDNVWRFSYMPLILYNPAQLHYEERHDKICFNGEQQHSKKIINGIMQINDHALRTQDRIAKGYIFKVLNRRVEMGKLPKEVLEVMTEIGN